MSRVYVGPSIPGILPRFAVFSGGLPLRIEKLAQASQALRGLIVPAERLAQARLDIAKKGTLLNLYAERVARELKGNI